MAILNIRNLPDDVHARLRLRAARNGRSMEAEARDILARVCASESRKPSRTTRASIARIQAMIERRYGANKPKSAVDDLIAERRREAARE